MDGSGEGGIVHLCPSGSSSSKTVSVVGIGLTVVAPHREDVVRGDEAVAVHVARAHVIYIGCVHGLAVHRESRGGDGGVVKGVTRKTEPAEVVGGKRRKYVDLHFLGKGLFHVAVNADEGDLHLHHLNGEGVVFSLGGIARLVPSNVGSIVLIELHSCRISTDGRLRRIRADVPVAIVGGGAEEDAMAVAVVGEGILRHNGYGDVTSGDGPVVVLCRGGVIRPLIVGSVVQRSGASVVTYVGRRSVTGEGEERRIRQGSLREADALRAEVIDEGSGLRRKHGNRDALGKNGIGRFSAGNDVVVVRGAVSSSQRIFANVTEHSGLQVLRNGIGERTEVARGDEAVRRDGDGLEGIAVGGDVGLVVVIKVEGHSLRSDGKGVGQIFNGVVIPFGVVGIDEGNVYLGTVADVGCRFGIIGIPITRGEGKGMSLTVVLVGVGVGGPFDHHLVDDEGEGLCRGGVVRPSVVGGKRRGNDIVIGSIRLRIVGNDYEGIDGLPCKGLRLGIVGVSRIRRNGDLHQCGIDHELIGEGDRGGFATDPRGIKRINEFHGGGVGADVGLSQIGSRGVVSDGSDGELEFLFAAVISIDVCARGDFGKSNCPDADHKLVRLFSSAATDPHGVIGIDEVCRHGVGVGKRLHVTVDRNIGGVDHRTEGVGLLHDAVTVRGEGVGLAARGGDSDRQLCNGPFHGAVFGGVVRPANVVGIGKSKFGRIAARVDRADEAVYLICKSVLGDVPVQIVVEQGSAIRLGDADLLAAAIDQALDRDGLFNGGTDVEHVAVNDHGIVDVAGRSINGEFHAVVRTAEHEFVLTERFALCVRSDHVGGFKQEVTRGDRAGVDARNEVCTRGERDERVVARQVIRQTHGVRRSETVVDSGREDRGVAVLQSRSNVELTVTTRRGFKVVLSGDRATLCRILQQIGVHGFNRSTRVECARCNDDDVSVDVFVFVCLRKCTVTDSQRDRQDERKSEDRRNEPCE